MLKQITLLNAIIYLKPIINLIFVIPNHKIHILMQRKLLLLLIKYIPIVQMAIITLNNVFIINDIFIFNEPINFTFGNSYIFSILLILCSYVFLFCAWQRIIIYANLILIILSTVWNFFDFGWDGFIFYVSSYCIVAVAIIIALIVKLSGNRKRTTCQYNTCDL